MSVTEILLPFDVAVPPVKKMRAGDLVCDYEAGNLRTIKLGDTEIVRMIYGAVRDENWETIPATINDEYIEQSENAFIIQYTATYLSGGISYKAYFFIEGKADNSISFSMKGEALCSFKKNRIGLCVLHPITACAGREVTITEPAGTVYQSSFPVNISPYQPFLNIQQMDWQTTNGLQIQLQLKGDIFETEDHRNWTDSSYKTYCTPLHLPFPVTIEAGDTIEHQVILKVIQNENGLVSDSASTITEEKIAFPKIGYSRANNQAPFTDELVTVFKQVHFDHYRVELDITESAYPQQLLQAATEAILLNTKLELVIFLDDSYERLLPVFIDNVTLIKDSVASVLVLHKKHKTTPHKLMEAVYSIIKKEFPLIQTGYGTDAYFTELNRNPPEQSPFDFVSFSINPQVHATDTRTLLENLESQPDIIMTAKGFIGNKNIHISPVTLKKRKNPDAVTDVEDTQVADHRQHTSLNAFWTLLTIQNFSGASHITFYELLGATGIYQVDQPSPVYEVLKTLKQFDPKWIIRQYSNSNLLMNGLLVENEHGDRLTFKLSQHSCTEIKKLTI